ncbi:DUF2726 domain-containing protein [Rubripirellula amarantea]|nr:DUF2726 domain-containing protein [Rubripirellula amarantea]
MLSSLSHDLYMQVPHQNVLMQLLAKARYALALMSQGATSQTEECLAESLVLSPRTGWLSETDRKYFSLLTKSVANHGGCVIPNVRLTSIVKIANPANHLDELVRMDRKSVDFLICDGSLQPCLVVILIDSKGLSSRLPRDYAVDLLKRAKIPVIQLLTDQAWNEQKFSQLLSRVLNEGSNGEFHGKNSGATYAEVAEAFGQPHFDKSSVSKNKYS